MMQVSRIWQAREAGKCLELPKFTMPISAGFPKDVEELIEGSADLADYVIENREATYYMEVSGDSMIEVGIDHGDILVVDTRLTACNGDIVIASIEGELLVKLYHKENGKVFLLPGNANYQPIEMVSGEYNFVWAVVIAFLHRLRRKRNYGWLCR